MECSPLVAEEVDGNLQKLPLTSQVHIVVLTIVVQKLGTASYVILPTHRTQHEALDCESCSNCESLQCVPLKRRWLGCKTDSTQIVEVSNQERFIPHALLKLQVNSCIL